MPRLHKGLSVLATTFAGLAGQIGLANAIPGRIPLPTSTGAAGSSSDDSSTNKNTLAAVLPILLLFLGASAWRLWVTCRRYRQRRAELNAEIAEIHVRMENLNAQIAVHEAEIANLNAEIAARAENQQPNAVNPEVVVPVAAQSQPESSETSAALETPESRVIITEEFTVIPASVASTSDATSTVSMTALPPAPLLVTYHLGKDDAINIKVDEPIQDIQSKSSKPG